MEQVSQAKSDSILEGIYQKIEPALVDDGAKDFKPWHKPRKHYLRVNQWCTMLRALISELGYKEGDTVRYLGLPGRDFLDLRTLEGVCRRAGVSLKYLGFDSSAQTDEYETLLSKHEISSLTCIDPFSVLARDRIERITKEDSVATELFQRLGAFDVINLDICGSVLESVGDGSYFDTLGRLCDLQLRCGRAKPWLVFVATRAIRAQVNDAAKAKLFDFVLQNIESSDEFGALLEAELSLNEESLRKEVSNEESLSHAGLVSALGVGLGKWLLNLTMSAHPKVIVRLMQSYSYRVEQSDPDMLSLAFRFEPIVEARRDASGLAAARGGGAALATEIGLAKDLVRGVAGIRDVDQALANDPVLFEKVLTQSGEVLRSARYDIDAYRTWALDGVTYGSRDHLDRGKVRRSATNTSPSEASSFGRES